MNFFYQMNFRAFSEGDFLFALPFFFNSVLLFVKLRGRRGHLYLYNRKSIFYEAKEYFLKLMMSQQILALVRSLLCHMPCPLSSCRKG